MQQNDLLPQVDAKKKKRLCQAATATTGNEN
jgi:hypothetical protein